MLFRLLGYDAVMCFGPVSCVKCIKTHVLFIPGRTLELNTTGRSTIPLRLLGATSTAL